MIVVQVVKYTWYMSRLQSCVLPDLGKLNQNLARKLTRSPNNGSNLKHLYTVSLLQLANTKKLVVISLLPTNDTSTNNTIIVVKLKP